MSTDPSAKPSTPDPAYTANVFGGDDPLFASVRKATLGRYDILGEIGRGGMACVYLAHDIAMDRKVAVKVLLPEVLKQAGMIERFKQEARTAGKLAHPNIVPIYGVDDSADCLYFVMKFAEGRPLNSVIKELGPLPFDMIRTITTQVAAGLDFAHRKGVIHRDVKPSNVMIETEGFALVMDFGIAKVSTDLGLTHSGAILGTPYYMSPEQAVGAKVSPASDQYSVGVMAYEMITGVRPFEDQSYGALAVAHSTKMAPPIVGHRPDCPPPMREAVERMMAKNPEQRFGSMREAAVAFCSTARDDAEAVRHTMIDLAKSSPRQIDRVSTPVSPPIAPPTAPPAPASPKAPAATPRARRLGWPIAAGTLAVGFVGYLAFMAFKPNGSREIVDSVRPPAPDTSRMVDDKTTGPDTSRRAIDGRRTVTPQGSDFAYIQVSSTENIPVDFSMSGKYFDRLWRPRVIAVPPGVRVPLSWSAQGCTNFDTTVIVRAGDTARIGHRVPTCRPAWIEVGAKPGMPGPITVQIFHARGRAELTLSEPGRRVIQEVSTGAGISIRAFLNGFGCTAFDTNAYPRGGDTARLGLIGARCPPSSIWTGEWTGVGLPTDARFGGGRLCSYNQHAEQVSMRLRARGDTLVEVAASANMIETIIGSCPPEFPAAPPMVHRYERSSTGTVRGDTIEVNLRGVGSNATKDAATFSGRRTSQTEIAGVLTISRIDQPNVPSLNYVLRIPVTLRRTP